MTFAYPWFFLLLIPLALALLAAWRKREPGIRIPSIRPYEMASKHTLRVMNWRKMTLFALWAAGGIFCVVALARPQEGLEEIKQRADGIDIIIALDLSGSMEAIDIPSSVSSQAQLNSQLRDGTLKNRLETAKAEIRKFIEARPNDRIGLIVFAQLPYVACPPTLDHAWLIANLERLNPGDIGDATGIAGPLASAVQRLKDSDAKSRVVVLFTDGRNNVSAKVTPRQAAKLADTFNITVYTVGIGSNNAIARQTGLFGSSYVPVHGEFDEELLRDIASTSGGRYYKAADAEGMAQAMSEIDKLEKTSVEQPVVINWRELYPFFCYAAGAAFLLAFALRNSLLISIP